MNTLHHFVLETYERAVVGRCFWIVVYRQSSVELTHGNSAPVFRNEGMRNETLVLACALELHAEELAFPMPALLKSTEVPDVTKNELRCWFGVVQRWKAI